MIELYPERMSAVDILVENSHLDLLLKELHKEGILQIDDISSSGKDYLELVEKSSTPEEVKDIAGMMIKLEELLADFDMGEKGPKASIKEMIFPPIPPKVRVKRATFDELKEEYLKLHDALWERVEGLAERISSSEEDMERKRKQIEDLEKLKIMDMDLSDLGEGPYVSIRVGEIREPEILKKELSKIHGATYDIRMYFKKKKVEKFVVVVVFESSNAARVSSALRKAVFQDFDTEGLKGSPEDAIRTLLREIEGLKKEIVALKKEMSSIAHDWSLKVKALLEELEIEKNRVEALASMGRTKSTSVISGWVPKKDGTRLERLVSDSTQRHAVVFFSEPGSEDEKRVPVKMKNAKWSKPFESLTNMFSRPKYNEIDPTMIIAPLFVIFFGLMLGDALYGVVITIGGVLIWKGLGRVDEGTRDFGIIITLSGISTVIFGMVQGGYFGPFNEQAPNLLQLLGIDYVPALIDPLNDPVTMLVIGLLIGLFQINLGIILSFYQHLKDRDYREAVLSEVSWFVLEPAGFILISSGLFGWFTFPPWAMSLSWIMAIIGLALLGIKSKMLALFDITGFLGNFLSYARILALGLGTAGIALTINMMIGMVMEGRNVVTPAMCGAIAAIGVLFGILALRKPKKRYKILGGLFIVFGVVGAISVPAAFALMGAIMFVVGHLGNVGLQALGSFVHSLRLQYVEFFGYFYEGGGREFRPFSERRKITEIDEVNR